MTEETVFVDYSRYYDLLYRDKDYAAEADYVYSRLEKFCPCSIGTLLEFGSGTGIHARLLAKKGVQVTGIEYSAEMVAQAEITENFTCCQGDIREARLNSRFDAVVSLFHVMSYQTENSDMRNVFDRAGEHLNPGGIFLFDIWYTPAVLSMRPETRVKRVAVDDAIEVTRIAEPDILVNENRVDVHYTVFINNTKTKQCHTVKETHPMRYFSLPEIDLFAECSGFERICAEEFLTGEELGEKTWGACIVLQKKCS